MPTWQNLRRPSYGPCGNLLEVCASVGWQIEPPFTHDRDGVSLNSLKCDHKNLEDISVDAWRHGVALVLSKRKDVAGLQGIYWRMLQAFLWRFPAFQKEMLHAL